MFDLTGKTAIVTGSGQGVGLGIARTLIDAGAAVYVNDLVGERAEAAAAELGPKAKALPRQTGKRGLDGCPSPLAHVRDEIQMDLRLQTRH